MKKQYYLAVMVMPLAIIMAFTLTPNIQLDVDTQTIDDKPTVHLDQLLQPFSLDDLSQKSDYIIIGTVESIKTDPTAYEFDGIKYLFTDIVINVEQDLTGKYADKQISVRLMGGENDEFKMTVENNAEFQIGERTLTFVSAKELDTVWQDHYYVTGITFGKYGLDDGKAFGNEYPQGLNESEFVAKIKNARDMGI